MAASVRRATCERDEIGRRREERSLSGTEIMLSMSGVRKHFSDNCLCPITQMLRVIERHMVSRIWTMEQQEKVRKQQEWRHAGKRTATYGTDS